MDIFTNRKPDEAQAAVLDEITDAMNAAYAVIDEVLPVGRYKSLAITKLEECSMFAKKSVLFPQ